MTADSIRHSVGERSCEDAAAADSRPLPPSLKRRPAWLDWLDSTDPGLMRLRMATEVVVAIGAVVLAEWVFIRTTGALQTPVPHGAPPAVATELWTLNHALLVIGIMLGAILALISGFGVGMYASGRAQLITLLFLPLPMLGLLAIGLSVHVRLLSLALLAVTLAIGTYCRRFGPRGFLSGMLAFMGAFLGFFIQKYVTLGEFGWLAAEVALGAAVTIWSTSCSSSPGRRARCTGCSAPTWRVPTRWRVTLPSYSKPRSVQAEMKTATRRQTGSCSASCCG